MNVAGSSVAYARNADYRPRQEAPDWTSGGKVVHFDRVEWKIIPDSSTAASALQAGEVNWYEQVQADLIPLLRRNPDILLAASNPKGYIGGMRFNHLHPPLDDVRMRRAILTAVNQDDYMRAVTGNDPSLYQICRSQFPCGTTYGSPVRGSAQSGDLASARAMIKEAYSGSKAVIINPTDFATIAPQIAIGIPTNPGCNWV
jgi:peptide/nickel transport system substrate-binding protein